MLAAHEVRANPLKCTWTLRTHKRAPQESPHSIKSADLGSEFANSSCAPSGSSVTCLIPCSKLTLNKTGYINCTECPVLVSSLEVPSSLGEALLFSSHLLIQVNSPDSVVRMPGTRTPCNTFPSQILRLWLRVWGFTSFKTNSRTSPVKTRQEGN